MPIFKVPDRELYSCEIPTWSTLTTDVKQRMFLLTLSANDICRPATGILRPKHLASRGISENRQQKKVFPPQTLLGRDHFWIPICDGGSTGWRPCHWTLECKERALFNYLRQRSMTKWMILSLLLLLCTLGYCSWKGGWCILPRLQTCRVPCHDPELHFIKGTTLETVDRCWKNHLKIDRVLILLLIMFIASGDHRRCSSHHKVKTREAYWG